MKAATALALAAALGASGGPLGPEAETENEKKILSEKDSWALADPTGVGSMRLSPDGTKLLYVRAEEAADKPPEGHRGMWSGKLYRLVLRDLESRKDTLLPSPAVTWPNTLTYQVSKPVFDKAGKGIALFTATDANKDGIFDDFEDTTQAAVYDIATGKVRTLGVTGDQVVVMYDRTGEGLLAGNSKRGRADAGDNVLFLKSREAEPKALAITGIPVACCPTADLIAVLAPDEKGGNPKFVLFDLEKGKVSAELPMAKEAGFPNPIRWMTPQWSADGKYLYYTDAERQEFTKYMTRVWDVKAGKEAFVLEHTFAVGPGPAGTMVMGRTNWNFVPQDAKLFLHEPAGGAVWRSDFKVRLIWAGDERIVYARRGADSAVDVYTAVVSRPEPQSRPATK